MGGLAAQSTHAATPTAGSSAGGNQFVALDEPYQESTPAAMSGQGSHLDSFFEGSGWTREDAELVLTALSTALLLYWAMSEVA